MNAAFSGFALGFSLILAIGAQNAFVLRQGLRQEYVLAVVLTCAISDAVLIVAGVTGFGAVEARLPWLGDILLFGGIAFLILYGARAAFSALRSSNTALRADKQPQKALLPTVLTCLALTWLNPHVYLDTVVFLGAVSAQYGSERWLFAMGAVLASFTFFFSLGYGARLLAPYFAKPQAWRILDAVIALVMWSIAAKLLSGAF